MMVQQGWFALVMFVRADMRDNWVKSLELCVEQTFRKQLLGGLSA